MRLLAADLSFDERCEQMVVRREEALLVEVVILQEKCSGRRKEWNLLKAVAYGQARGGDFLLYSLPHPKREKCG